MCGRFSLIDGTKKVEQRFGAKYVEAMFETANGPGPIYNAAPTFKLPMIVDNYKNSNEKRVILGEWGLRMAWSKSLRPQPNARLDTVHERKMFREAYVSRRCLIPANSFFEWQRTKGIKQPYRIMLKDDGLFAMAGIWESASLPDAPPTFSILTTEANSMMSKIHDRMPVILHREHEDRWLRELGSGVISNIPTQFPSEQMKMYPVTTRVNRVEFDDPQALKRITDPTLGF